MIGIQRINKIYSHQNKPVLAEVDATDNQRYWVDISDGNQFSADEVSLYAQSLGVNGEYKAGQISFDMLQMDRGALHIAIQGNKNFVIKFGNDIRIACTYDNTKYTLQHNLDLEHPLARYVFNDIKSSIETKGKNVDVQFENPLNVVNQQVTLNANTKSVITNNSNETIKSLINTYGSFVVPFISGAGGSGHTVYVVGLYDNQQNTYTLKMLNQTANVQEDQKLACLQLLSEVKDILAQTYNVQFDAIQETDIICGAFPPEQNIATCTEIGLPLIKAMVDRNLYQAIANSHKPFTMEEIIWSRLQGIYYTNHMREIEINVNNEQAILTCLYNTSADDRKHVVEHFELSENAKGQLQEMNLAQAPAQPLNMAAPELSQRIENIIRETQELLEKSREQPFISLIRQIEGNALKVIEYIKKENSNLSEANKGFLTKVESKIQSRAESKMEVVIDYLKYVFEQFTEILKGMFNEKSKSTKETADLWSELARASRSNIETAIR